MPTYEYQCSKCGHCFEAFQSIKDDPLTTCPVCDGLVKRLISAGAGLIFKGSGFYITDYKNKGNTFSEAGSNKQISENTPKGNTPKDDKNKAGDQKPQQTRNNND